MPETLTNATDRSQPAVLDTLHPGSWINGIFATWIGHPEKTAAWSLLAEIRDAIAASGSERPPSLLVAEASDWFWWLGDDNPTELAPLYDRIYRRHLTDACVQAGIEPPAALAKPLKTVIETVSVPVSSGWQGPILDGRKTSYFEWCIATRVETADREIDGLSLWAGPDRLHVLVEGRRPMCEIVTDAGLAVDLEPDDGSTIQVEIDTTGCHCPEADCALGHVVELSLPWNSRRPARLDIRRGDQSILDGAVLLLEPMNVDETIRPNSEE